MQTFMEGKGHGMAEHCASLIAEKLLHNKVAMMLGFCHKQPYCYKIQIHTYIHTLVPQSTVVIFMLMAKLGKQTDSLMLLDLTVRYAGTADK